MQQPIYNYKRYAQKFFFYTALVFVLVVYPYVVLYLIIDPLQIFHKSWFQDNRLNWSMREQAAGIINNFEFDSIILGTSILENTSAKEASQKIGGNFFNISVSGSSFFERSFVLKKALRKGIKSIVYSLDSAYLYCTTERQDYPSINYSFLYDRNILNDFKIYATKKYVGNRSPLFGTRIIDMDRPNAWYQTPQDASRFGGLEKWVENIDNYQVHDFFLTTLGNAAHNSQSKKEKLPEASKEYKRNVEKYLDQYLLNYARKYKDTQFYLIFPPYFRYTYASWRQNAPETFVKHQYAIRYIVEEAQKLKNVHVFGFEDQAFLDDIANYKDTTHYHYRFDSYFLDAIAQGKHEITTENLDEYLAKCDKLAYDFDIVKLNEEAQALIRKRNQTQKQQTR